MTQFAEWAWLAAIGTMLFSFKSTVVGFWQQIANLVVTRQVLPGRFLSEFSLAVPVHNWLHGHATLLYASERPVTLTNIRVDPRAVAANDSDNAALARQTSTMPQGLRLPPILSLWLVGWRPLLVVIGDNNSDGNYHSKLVHFYYLRRSFDAVWLLDLFTLQGLKMQQNLSRGRFSVYRVLGIKTHGVTTHRGDSSNAGSAPPPTAKPDGDYAASGRQSPYVTITEMLGCASNSYECHYVTAYVRAGVGRFSRYSCNARLPTGANLHDLDMPADFTALYRRTLFMLQHRTWFTDRGVPWKLGAAFVGSPGTGKTAAVRGLAGELDIPLFMFDLSTFDNHSLTTAWTDTVQGYAPCMIVLEDLDRVFSGDLSVQTAVTYDCLLNLLDGAAANNGVIVIVTANHPERLDAALLRQRPDGTFETRPGRIDYVVAFVALTEAGRQKLARRIIGDEYPDVIAEVVRDGAGETGAVFQLRCANRAQELFWEVHGDDTGDAE